jgi:hypothetical protein
MALLLSTAILLYTIPLAAMYLRGAPFSIEDSHFRYAGILFFLLLLLTAIDRWRIPLAKVPRMGDGCRARALWSKEFSYEFVWADADEPTL